MEKSIQKVYKKEELNNKQGEMAKVLITTLYGHTDPIMLICNKLTIDRIFVLIDNEMKADQKASLKKLQSALGNVLEIKTVKTSVLDIVKVADDVVKVIDVLSDKDKVVANVSGARRTQALGLLYGCYARIKHVDKIIYVDSEGKRLIYLPKLDYNLTNSQKGILEKVSKKAFKTHSELAEKMELSKGMLYRAISELIDLGLLTHDDEHGFKLTDAGRIGVL